jgi:hypothetical protein
MSISVIIIRIRLEDVLNRRKVKENMKDPDDDDRDGHRNVGILRT